MSNHIRFLSVFRVFITIAILLTSLPLSSPGITVQAAEPVPVIEEPERTPPGMRLYAVVDPAVVEPGAEATCTVTVVNEDVEDETGLTLHTRLSRELSPAKGEGRTWQADVPPLKMGERAEVALDLRVTGRPKEARTFEIELRDAGGKVRATTTAVVGVARADKAQRIKAKGGRFAAEDGRVRIDFHSGTLPAEASVTAKMKMQRVEPRGRAQGEPAGHTRSLLQFTLEAQDAATGESIHDFDRPVTLSVDLRGLIDESGLPAGQHLYLAYLADPETGRMNAVETIYDEETGLLTAEIDHFSDWEIGTVGEGWKPILTPPVPDLFSGAAVYNYPVQVPAGRNGLQPSGKRRQWPLRALPRTRCAGGVRGAA
jgi:hypothetical protein